jgi:Mg2+-importing ATPase
MTDNVPRNYWSRRAPELLAAMASSEGGLSRAEATKRLRQFGPNDAAMAKTAGVRLLLLRQFGSPLVLVLVIGAGLSFLLRQWTDAAIILAIVVASAVLGFSQEYRASTALAALKRRLALLAKVRRGGIEMTVPARDVVPGDVVRLSAGSLVPADGVLLSSRDFLVAEAALTGESLPVEKTTGISPEAAPLAKRNNCVFAGTSVRSGEATVLMMATGSRSALGQVAQRLESGETETEFERGVRQFGYLLIRVMIVMVLFVLTVSQALGRPLIESLLFAVALAVGMTPELLPAIVTVTLAAGARAMARQGVIVRRLEAIENLGSIDVLCTDKTGTLTEGTVTLAAALDPRGVASDEVLQLAFLNSAFETGIENPLDRAIVAAGRKHKLTPSAFSKVDEIPYDFVRKRLTIAVSRNSGPARNMIVTKGAFKSVLAVCSKVARANRIVPLDAAGRRKLQSLFERKGEEGFRVLAVAVRQLDRRRRFSVADERDMTLTGLLLFADPPKAGARKAISHLADLGIRLKMISGDSRQVSVHVANSLGLSSAHILSVPDIATMSAEALRHLADKTNIFVEVDPQQKELIIRALQKDGHAVGFLGDGINDAPALHAADVGISVEQAVDVARQSADIVLLRRDLDVLRVGVESGRRSFANTLKYISITTSANFGNMVSMALATPFLPFLPLFAKQILLNNFLSDLPSVAISADNVDAFQTRKAGRWNAVGIRRFMIAFGLVSSIFDLLTFALLLGVYHAGEALFQTAWFVVSLLTEVVVVLSLRTQGWAWRSQPGSALTITTLLVIVLAMLVPYLGPVAGLFGFVPLPLPMLAALVAVVVLYTVATETAKRWYYRSSG